MATRLIGTDTANPRLPVDVIEATQGATHADLAPGDIIVDANDYSDAAAAGAQANAFGYTDAALAEAKAYTDAQISAAVIDPADVAFADAAETLAGDSTTKAVTPFGLNATLPFVDVRAYGAVGDGTTDDTAAIQAAINAAATKRLICAVPTGTFNITAPLDVPTNSRIQGAAGSKLINNCPGTGDRLLRVVGATNVIVAGIELDGNKAAYAGVTEHRHNLGVINSNYVTIRDVHSHDAKGDGIYIGDDNNVADYCTHIAVEACRVAGNHRNGLSVVAVNDFKATDCTFINQTGTNPQAGVDVEPNTAATVCTDVKFVNCTMTGNVGCAAGISLHAAPTAQQGSVTFTNCEFTNSTDVTLGAGLRIRNPTDVRIIGCQVRSNAAEGVYVDQQGSFVGKGLVFSACNISENGLEGVQVFNVADIAWQGCEVNANSQAAVNTRDGISITPTAATAGFQIVGCRFAGVSQRYGVRTGSNAQKLTLVGNLYGTLGTAAVSLADEQASRFRAESVEILLAAASAGNVMRVRNAAEVNDRLVVRTDGEIRFGDGTISPDVRLFRNGANQLRTASELLAAKLYTLGELEIDGALNHDGTTVGFYNTTPIAKPAVSGSRGANAALASLCTQLAALGLITDSTTA